MRRISGLVIAGIIALTLSPAVAKTPMLGIAAIDLQNSFFVRLRQASDVAAKDYGVRTTWQSSQGSLEKEVSIIENYINQGVSAILVDPIDKNALVPVLEKAEKAHIPVITMGNKVYAGGNYLTLYPDYRNMSTIARILGKSMGSKGEIALLVGSRGNFVSDTREKGFVDTMKKDFPDIKVVSVEPTDWSADKASDITQTWLTTYPNLKAVACVFDALCIAADTVATSMNSNLIIGSYGGDDEILGLVDKGRVVVDVLTGAYRVGYWNIAVAARLIQGEKMPPDLYLPTYIIATDATANKMKAQGLSFQHITPTEAAIQSKNFGVEFGPQVPVSAMTTKP